MFMAVGAASSALSYLQSLLAQGTAGTGSTANADPLSSLLGGLSGAESDGDTPNSPAGSTGSAAPTPSFDPGTMAALISLQGQGGPQGSSSLFAKLDTDGNGQISKTEFETTLGNAGVDQTSADALFDKLDANGDGSIDPTELAKARHGRGHHHHMHTEVGAQGSGSSGQGGIASLLSAPDATGATTQTASNADGSSTTTITYADGSKVEMTSPATASGSAILGAVPSDPNTANLIERLIQMQAQLLNTAASTTSTVA
jgi:hypothetical protein